MNCEKFENRVQQLLDERATLSLDLPVRLHAKECDDCRTALSIYEQFSEFSTSSVDEQLEPVLLAKHPSVELAHPSKFAAQSSWQSRQLSHRRYRMMVAAAAIVFICSALISRPSKQSPLVFNYPLPGAVDPLEELPVTKALFSDSLTQLGGLLEYVPNDFSGLTSHEYLDLSSLGRIDLVSLVPENQIRAVRGIPATLESMEPIYRVSAELPVLQQWSNGIHCTLGLIQTSLPSSRQKPLVTPSSNDLGNRQLLNRFDRRNIC